MFNSQEMIKSKKKDTIVKDLCKSAVISFDMMKTTKRNPIKNSKMCVSTEGKLLFDRIDEYIKKTYSSKKEIK